MSRAKDSDPEGLGRKFDELARRCRLDAEDEAKALSIYQDMVESIADCIVARDARAGEARPAMVYIAAYRHRYGVDLSAHASHADAESRLLSIAWQQCMRDASIRAAVDARFGPLVADEPPLEEPFAADEYEPGFGGEYGRPFQSSHEVSHEVSHEPPHEASRDRSSGPQPSRRYEPRADAASESNDADSPAQWLAVFGSTDDEPHDQSGAWARDPGHRARRQTFCEQLLEEWPELADGEQLWIVCCEVEGGEHGDSGPDRGGSESSGTRAGGSVGNAAARDAVAARAATDDPGGGRANRHAA